MKRFLREKPSHAELEALIDRTMAFYNKLDPDQQRKVRRRLARHARRHS